MHCPGVLACILSGRPVERVCLGAAIGAAAAAVASRVATSAFYDIRPPNAEMIASSVVIALGLVFTWCVVPAARLGTFDIVGMLRD